MWKAGFGLNGAEASTEHGKDYAVSEEGKEFLDEIEDEGAVVAL